MKTNDTPNGDDLDISVTPREVDWVVFGVGVCFSVLVWLAVLWQLVFYLPKCHRTFDAFNMKLPEATVLVIHHAWWTVPVSVLVTLAVCLATRSRWAWLVLMIALPIVLNVVIFLSMYWPQQMLLEALAR
jgi:ABC-type phosphate transport system permease subunit